MSGKSFPVFCLQGVASTEEQPPHRPCLQFATVPTIPYCILQPENKLWLLFTTVKPMVMLLAIHLTRKSMFIGQQESVTEILHVALLSSVFATSAPWTGQEGAELAEGAKSPPWHACDD